MIATNQIYGETAKLLHGCKLFSLLGRAFSIVIVGCVMLMFIQIAIWLFWPYQPITIYEPLEVMNVGKVVEAGSDLVYRIRFVKNSDAQGLLSRQLINSYIINFSPVVTAAPVGPGDNIVRVPVPKSADPGKYYLQWVCSYEVNPLRKVLVSAKSENFEVVAPR